MSILSPQRRYDTTNERKPSQVSERTRRSLSDIDGTVIDFLRRHEGSVLRVSLALVMIWFGALKVLGVSDVTELVANTVYWFDPDWFVPALGGFEVLVGVGFLIGRPMRPILMLFLLHMVGTFLVFVIQPEVAFRGSNLLLLTEEGQFVVKNLVLLAAGLAIGSRLTPALSWNGRPATT